jgi:hypothetical protein
MFEDETIALLPQAIRSQRLARPILSHSIRRVARAGSWPTISPILLRAIADGKVRLPNPSEQLDNLIVWLAATQADAGATVEDMPQAISVVGAANHSGFGFIVSTAISLGFVQGEVKVMRALGASDACVILPMQLSFAGWERLGQLQRGQAIGRIAFMAMPFGHENLDKLYLEQFKPAVAATGFTLKRLDEEQPAGLIDDRLRVEIRQSRFLIADLTHGNPGAYWEAGYAEGLDKPVIYTCRQDKFDDKGSGPHFDTNHHLIVLWNPANLHQAVAKLKATIRATLPAEAKLAD